MMKFQLVLDALVNKVLGPAEKNCFRTIGYQDQKRAAEEVLDNLRTVQVFYDGGNFPKSGGAQTGPQSHDVIIAIELTVARAIRGDLQTIESGTVPQKIRALAAMKSASKLAEDSVNDLIDIVYNILMDGRNIDLQLPEGVVSNRWIQTIEKKSISDQGEYVVLSATMNMSLRVSEEPSGDKGVPITTDAFDNTVDIDDDDIEKTGVTV
jgi:hypothetical protein